MGMREEIGHAASPWGIEPFPNDDYMTSVVADHVDEILAEIRSDEIKRVRETFSLSDAIR